MGENKRECRKPVTRTLDELFTEMEIRHTRWGKLLQPFRCTWYNYNPRELRRKVRWGVQRWRRGYSDLDVWNTDHHLCRIIPPMMRQLSRELHGVPGHLVQELGSMDAAASEWRRILEAVAAGFEAQAKIAYEYPEGARLAELTAQWDTGSTLLIKHFGAFWD